MNKPTIFFSHSSKDKELILPIKNKLDKSTSGAIEIFMSSDGQSIPFGSNWIHKIEEGLQVAKIMFVFVTERSISSGWIYFEAGYAYSKGIQVIPVGIGIDIGELRAPLNLLQGFNILSEDSLDNFITVINRTFDCHFESGFGYSDYLEVIGNLRSESFNTVKIKEVVSKAECEINGKQVSDDTSEKYDIDEFFNEIINYLSSNNIPFSKNDKYYNERTVCIVSNGVKIIYRKEVPTIGGHRRIYGDYAKISFSVSLYNFFNAFTLLKNLLQLRKDKKTGYIKLHLKEKFSYITTAEDGSSILSAYPEFEVDKNCISGYVCSELGVKFHVFDDNEYRSGCQPNYVAVVVFDKDSIQTENIIRLVDKLCDVGFIIEK